MAPVSRIIAALLGLASLAAPAIAQDKYPSRQISIVVGFPPGGTVDLAARALAPALQKVTGQTVVVVTKAGAAGGIGAQAVAIAPPDGYTVGIATSQVSLLPAIDVLFERKPAFQRTDFIPVTRLTSEPLLFTINAELPWKTFADLVEDAKKRPGEIVYASGGLYGVSHIPVELVQKEMGIKLRHLPTAGGGPALTAVLGGNATFSMQGPAASLPHVKSGKARVLAAMGDKRQANFPDVPTLKELGFKSEYYNWTGVFLPAKTPEPIVAALEAAIAEAVKQPEFTETILKAGSAPDILDRAAFTRWFDQHGRDSEEHVKLIGKVQ